MEQNVLPSWVWIPGSRPGGRRSDDARADRRSGKVGARVDGKISLSVRLIAVAAGSSVLPTGTLGEDRAAAVFAWRRRRPVHEDFGMKIYEGRRTIDGIVVTVDGAPLSAHAEVKQFTKYGFEWTYEGDSPRQLALAILFDHLGDADRAVALAEPFMKSVIANLDNDWRLSGDDVAAFARRYQTRALQDTH
jgi:hypothetical protein